MSETDLGWFTRFRVRQLRKAKAIAIERFRLAYDSGNSYMAFERHINVRDIVRRIERLTNTPEPPHLPPPVARSADENERKMK